MQTFPLPLCQGIRGFTVEKQKELSKAAVYALMRRSSALLSDEEAKAKCLVLHLRRNRFECPHCHCKHVRTYKVRERVVQGARMGKAFVYLVLPVHRIVCPHCGRKSHEHFPFLPSPQSRVTRALEGMILMLRKEMCISALARFLGVSWRIVKDIEKTALSRQYARVPLKAVRALCIDEMYVFPSAKSNRKYITIVRDADTGAVLSVTRGKGEAALKALAWRLRKAHAKIVYVCMDMSNAYSAWVQKTLPEASIVFDPFHLIKSVNDRLDHVRRRVVRALDERAAKAVKKRRFTILRNGEDLDEKGRKELEALRAASQELSDAYTLKEDLRRIYRTAKTAFDAMCALRHWIKMAKESDIPEMAAAGAMVERHLKGILGHWRHGATNASMEGFNGKVRWLIKQAFGFHDFKYFKLKIFDLPNTNLAARL